jgi:hypothetical protein
MGSQQLGSTEWCEGKGNGNHEGSSGGGREGDSTSDSEGRQWWATADKGKGGELSQDQDKQKK